MMPNTFGCCVSHIGSIGERSKRMAVPTAGDNPGFARMYPGSSVQHVTWIDPTTRNLVTRCNVVIAEWQFKTGLWRWVNKWCAGLGLATEKCNNCNR